MMWMNLTNNVTSEFIGSPHNGPLYKVGEMTMLLNKLKNVFKDVAQNILKIILFLIALYIVE